MGPLELINHVANLFLPAVALGALAAALAKLAWRAELAAKRWWSMAALCAAVNSGITVAGLAWFGRDGRMATYGAMVLATSLTLWWRGFGRGRR